MLTGGSCVSIYTDNRYQSYDLDFIEEISSGRKKIAGILTELAAEPDQINWVVVGVGVNVNARAEDFPPELRDQATEGHGCRVAELTVLLKIGRPSASAPTGLIRLILRYNGK